MRAKYSVSRIIHTDVSRAVNAETSTVDEFLAALDTDFCNSDPVNGEGRIRIRLPL